MRFLSLVYLCDHDGAFNAPERKIYMVYSEDDLVRKIGDRRCGAIILRSECLVMAMENIHVCVSVLFVFGHMCVFWNHSVGEMYIYFWVDCGICRLRLCDGRATTAACFAGRPTTWSTPAQPSQTE